MALRWTDPSAAAHLLERLGSVVKLQPDGTVSLGLGFDFDTSADILAATCPLSREVPPTERVAIVRHAIVQSTKEQDLTPQNVLKHAAAKQTQYLRLRTQSFVLVTTISLDSRDVPLRRRMGAAAITLSRHTPRHFRFPERVTKSRIHYGDPPRDYVSVRVRVSARRPEQAADLALSSVDLLRAIWNLHINRRTAQRISGGRVHPVNNVVLGPIHTVHHPDGTPATDVYWWEPSYVEPLRAFSLRERAKPLKRFERLVRLSLKRSPFADLIQKILLQYVRALDDRQLSSAFVKLWAALEEVTLANGNYDSLIRRSTFLWREQRYHRLVLHHLRLWRNRIVHDGEDTSEAERMVFQLKQYVEHMLLFFIRRSHVFETLGEYGQFLDLPENTAILHRRMRLYRWAHRIHT